MTAERSPIPFPVHPPRMPFGSPLSSFSDHLRMHAPELLPENRPGLRGADADIAPHGTTIVAVTFAGGVLIAGDRRATMGNMVASRDVEKVFVTDSYSAAGIAGTAGLAIELVRLFAVELEHYEKIEGVPLTFDGKANRLSSMVRGNLGAAMQGLAVVPLLVGYDLEAPEPQRAGRIVSYDVVGGRYEERAGYHAVGSGSLFAKSSLKKLYRADADEAAALRTVVEALYDAADDDTATGGPDTTRGIYPTAVVITADGATEVPEQTLSALARTVVADRTVAEHGQGGAQ
ncbi:MULTISPECIES: proteasome subunit beta [Rhodococcus]|uniref:Proteasome subunit beta n=2 Tax=Rhodococcus aetherivorans TaxID=191292 RepID=A0ABQ0YTY3_9NOCA|nr:proteasome subunit beta [Rhodococcus aetherivorans]ANZ25145.1 proteasome subunit beta [Rhodococcus sp. WB1]ETT24344.1 Peptidase T1A, proteasome beta-subunit, actinobacteria [Rhodococcus rhodochrous ATCC 21198]NCL76881.1 Proteasome subunit beta 1 [Rhodococcus sp. YH1]PND52575.1 proteasome subunit beta [Rhodococcus sp. ENV425]QIX50601.1 proteasome subunit beta [Rhodococcus sp. DMU1]